MTSYFYTDPLAAAWMAKHFGMRFLHEGTSNECDILALIAAGVFRSQSIDLSVHPESLYLLEPRAGDKVSYSFGVGPHAGEAWDEVKGIIAPNDEGYPYTGNGELYVLVDGCDEFPLSRLKELFQRDGKPFHWPERKAA